MDNAIVSFPGFDRFGLAFDRKSTDLRRQISIAELLGRGSVQRAGVLDTLLSITQRRRQNLKPATRTATNAGMSDIEEAVRAILKACAELSAAQAALDHKPDATTAPRDYAVTKVIEAFYRSAAGAQAARKPLAIKITLTPQSS